MTTMARAPSLYAAPSHQALVLPADVRWMNLIAFAVYAGTALALLAAGALWLTRTPWFTIRAIELEGELTRNSINTIRANATPGLQGNFFSVDLQQSRRAFEAVPWVRQAVVRRVWPDRLAVQLQEHRAVALWQGDDRGDRLVNQHGEVFEANLGDVEDEALPMFSGPEGSATSMLALYRKLTPMLSGMKSEVDSLVLSSRGSWRVVLESGATLELGRGGEDEVLARTQRFVATLPDVHARFGKALEYADLRHSDGYAVRLRGLTTGAAAPKKN
jgi:cell division protein FtsQ